MDQLLTCQRHTLLQNLREAAYHRRHLRQPVSSLQARFRLAALDASRVIGEHALGFFRLVPLQQLGDVIGDVARRNAPGVGREQNAALALLRHGRPKLAIENFGVILNGESGARHALFAGIEHFAQRFHLTGHAIEHFPHRVHSQISTLESLQGKADGQMLG